MTQDYWAGAAGGEGAPPAAPEPPYRRRWPILVLVLAVLGGLWLWGSRAGRSESVLDVGSQRGGTKALMLASGALDGAPYRVEWSEFPAAQNLLEAIGAGAVDVGLAGDAPFQFAYQSGQPIRAVAALSARPRPPGALAILVPRGSAITDVAGLRGKRIATGRGSIGHYTLLRVLEAHGLKPTDVTISFLSPGDAKAAFDSSSIDAWSTWSPYVPTALASGARIVADGSDYFDSAAFDVANADAAVAKKALLADFLRREARAYVWARAHPRDYARVLARETGLPAGIALYHVAHQPLVRVPIDAALKAGEQDVVGHFRSAGALAVSRPLDDAYLPLDQGN
ncbi:MAG TPA: ABC transporter substrate-binding protein [Sphingomonas sp.]